MLPKLYIFTGSGISSKSGIPTFRGSDGLWNGYNVDEVATIYALYRNPEKVMSFFQKLQEIYKDKEPNEFHKGIADLQTKYGHERVIVMTQNIDDLFEKAGWTNVIHLHGKLGEFKCSKCGKIDIIPSREEHKGRFIRPNIVLFGELCPSYKILDDCLNNLNWNDIWITTGTSGQVIDLRKRCEKRNRIHRYKKPRFWNCHYFLNNFDCDHYNIIPMKRTPKDTENPDERYFIGCYINFLTKIYPKILEIMG